MEHVSRIGVCEDSEPIRRVLVRALRQAGHEVVDAHNGREAVTRLAPGGSQEPALDVIIMDIGLPDADGRDVVQALQSAGQTAPVLFLTALGGAHEILSGFAAGGDDYVVKPFAVAEVLARVEVLARRGPAGQAHAAAVPADRLDLDPLAHAARSATGQVQLTPTEFRLLAAIAARPGEVVRRRAVVAAGWPDGAMVSENTIDSFLRRIRAKLDDIDSPLVIETVRGVGFTTTPRADRPSP